MSYAHILPEIHMSRAEVRNTATPFPAACPACGAEKAFEQNGYIVEYLRTATYDCGASYTLKGQIQNHTEKWWGSCPVTKAGGR